MLTHAYRLVAPHESFEQQAQQANAWHGLFASTGEPEPALAVAWESPELAALSSEDFLWNQQRRTLLLRETLVLPREAGLQKIMPPSAGCVFESLAQMPQDLLSLVTTQKLLVLWLPSALARHQHVALINLRHAAFARVGLSTRQLMLTRPVQRAAFESAGPVVATPQPLMRLTAPQKAPTALYAQLAG
jgi:hypothetical protein